MQRHMLVINAWGQTRARMQRYCPYYAVLHAYYVSQFDEPVCIQHTLLTLTRGTFLFQHERDSW